MARGSTTATKAATSTPQKFADENTYPFDSLMASLGSQKKMAAGWKAVLTPTKEKKRKSNVFESGDGGGLQADGEGAIVGTNSVAKPKKKKKKKKYKLHTHQNVGVGGAPRRTTLTKGDRERLKREEAEREAQAGNIEDSNLEGVVGDAETNERMKCGVEVSGDGENLRIVHNEEPLDSETDQWKAHHGERGAKAHRKDTQVAEEYDAIMDGSFLDNLMSDKIGTQTEATYQPGIDAPSSGEGELSIEEVEQTRTAKKERSERKKKKGKNKAHKKGRESLDRELDEYMSGEQGYSEANQARDVDIEDSLVGVTVNVPELNGVPENAGADDLEMESQSLESQIRAQLSKSQKKKKRKLESQEPTLNLDDSIVGYTGDVEVDDPEAKKERKRRKKEKKAKRESQLQINDGNSVEDAATQQINAAEAEIENPKEVAIQQKTLKPSPKKLEGQKITSFVPYKTVTNFNKFAQIYDKDRFRRDITESSSLPKEKVKKQSQKSYVVSSSLPEQNGNGGADDETASASESDRDDFLDTGKKIVSPIPAPKARAAIPLSPEKGKKNQTAVNNAAVPIPIPGIPNASSNHEDSIDSTAQSTGKEKTFPLPSALIDRATIRQEQMASQKDELRNTIIRAKNATPVKPTVIAKPAVIAKPRSPKLVKKEPETETSADEGPLANFINRPKVSPVPPPQHRQLISRPASRAPPSAPSFKKPIKARGGDSSDTEPLSRAVNTIRKNSLSRISSKMFNTASSSNENRRVVTSSVTDIGNEKLVLVEDPDWEAATGKVRARIGGDDAEGEENIAFSFAYLKSHPEGIRVGNTHFSRIITIAPGSPYTFPAGVNETETNFCTIVGGQGAVITVGPAGEETRKRFSMRAGGMWVVKKGMSCVVANATTDLVVLNVWSVWEA